MLLWVCFSLSLIATSFVLLSFWSTLPSLITITLLRSAGSSVVWVYSSVLIQVKCDENYLGRVSSVEFAAATSMEGASALLAALGIDFLGLEPQSVASVVGFCGGFMALAVSFGFGKRWVWAKFTGGSGNMMMKQEMMTMV